MCKSCKDMPLLTNHSSFDLRWPSQTDIAKLPKPKLHRTVVVFRFKCLSHAHVAVWNGRSSGFVARFLTCMANACVLKGALPNEAAHSAPAMSQCWAET